MKPFAVYLIALACVFAVAQSCTRETCPPGPVTLNFDNSDCSGEPTSIMGGMAQEPGFDSCLTDGYESSIAKVEDGYLKVAGFYGPNCNFELDSWDVTEYAIGKCLRPNDSKKRSSSSFEQKYLGSVVGRRNAAATSSMILASVNDTYVSPQPQTPHNDAFPKPYPISFECYSHDNCSLNGVQALFWNTYYDDVNCTTPYSSDAVINVTYGTCYQSNIFGDTYYNSECLSESVTRSTWFVGNGCETPIYRGTTRRACGRYSNTAQHCTALSSEPTPSSSANSVSAASSSPLLLLALFFLSLGLFQ